MDNLHRQLTLLFLITVALQITDLSATALENTPRPIPAPPTHSIKLYERTTFCFAGYGSQHHLFRIEGVKLRDRENTTPYLPTTHPSNAIFIKLGCVFGKIFVDYAFFEHSASLNQNSDANGTGYDSIQYSTYALTSGYSFTLIPNELHFDLGVGIAQTQFSLGRCENRPSCQMSDAKNERNVIVSGNLKLFINHYLFLHWSQQKSTNPNSTLYYTNQLGLNFSIRY